MHVAIVSHSDWTGKMHGAWQAACVARSMWVNASQAIT
jgi:hypothetical protein